MFVSMLYVIWLRGALQFVFVCLVDFELLIVELLKFVF